MSGINYKSQIHMSVPPTEEKHVARLREAVPALMTGAQFKALEVDGKYPELARRTVVLTDADPEKELARAVFPDYANLLDSKTISGVSQYVIDYDVPQNGFLSVYGAAYINDNFTNEYVYLAQSINGVVVGQDWSGSMASGLAGNRVNYELFRFVAKGDKYRVVFGSSAGALQGNQVITHYEMRLYGNKTLEIIPARISKDYKNVLVYPDYTKPTDLASTKIYTIDTLSWISVLVNTITIPQSGYIFCRIESSYCCYHHRRLNITINGLNIQLGSSNYDDLFSIFVPVNTGDIVRYYVTYAEALTGVTVYIECMFYPNKYIDQVPPVISEQYRNCISAPDYSKGVELLPSGSYTATLTSTQNVYESFVLKTITVNQSGYIVAGMELGNADWTKAFRIYKISVNGQAVYDSANDDNGTVTELIPIIAGDVVTYGVATVIAREWTVILSCMYYPSRFAEVQANRISDRYTTGEQLTGETWIDGKPIYRRVFTGNLVASVDTSVSTPLMSGVDSLIKQGGWLQEGNNANKHPIVGRIGTNSATLSSTWIFVNGNTLTLISITHIDRVGTSNNAYQVWAEYTKL
jgi:hypothetical protein